MENDNDNNNTQRSYFRIRTAPVNLKVDIHPPCGINIYHVEGESFHTSVMRQGEEILHYVVYKELETRNLHHLITNESILLQRIFRTSQGHLLLTWENLCKSLHRLYCADNDQFPRKIDVDFTKQICHCPRRVSPTRCSGYLCFLTDSLALYPSFHLKTVLLFHYAASTWCVEAGDLARMDTIIRESYTAMEHMCGEHDTDCYLGWDCILKTRRRQHSWNLQIALVVAAVSAGLLLTVISRSL